VKGRGERKSGRKVAVVIGTRPEAIKLAPVIRELGRARHAPLRPLVVLTAQHREMADEVLNVFRIRPDYDLDVMRHDQSLFQVTTAILSGLERVFRRERPCAVLVQGDTTYR
jgi:UDP-N-acetylglucosamine 2-epimerase (non-hydrolysing)